MTVTWAALTITACLAAIVLAAALLLGTCGTSEAIERRPLTIIAANGTTARLHVEVADTPEERATGLMHRTELPLDTGMLFVIEPPGRGFYMRNTRIPLTVAFIDECGVIVDFADLEPLSEEIKNTDKPYSYGLEAAQGWFERNGIATGDIVSIPRDLRSAACGST